MREGTDMKGVVCAAVTPIDPQGAIDVVRLSQHCAQVLTEGCAFTSVFGTTGEGASFSVRERIAALQALADLGMDMSQQIPGVMATSVDDAAALYRASFELGCRAALIIPPYYYAPSGPSGVGDFYGAVVERAGAPDHDILLYNFPHFSGVAFTPDVVREVISRCGGRIIGIKDSTGDLAGGRELIEQFPDLSIFTGDDRILGRMVAAGGAGMIGGMVNLFASDCVTIYQGQADAILQEKAKRRIEAVDQNGGLVVLKALLKRRSQEPAFARMAPPLQPISAATEAKVAKALAGADALS